MRPESRRESFAPANGDDVPRTARSFSGIVFLGSDDSVNDPYPWVKSELRLASDAVACEVPVLGHCFGGQMLARALGAQVQPSAWPNIGWSSLRLTPAAKPIFGPVARIHAFNWHYESFAIPAGATRTLFGEHCLNKGFVFGPHLAFQGHFEVTEDIVRAWCDTHARELASASGLAVQHRDEILACLPERVAAVHTAARSDLRELGRTDASFRPDRARRHLRLLTMTWPLAHVIADASRGQARREHPKERSLPSPAMKYSHSCWLLAAVAVVFGVPFLYCTWGQCKDTSSSVATFSMADRPSWPASWHG